ncbi:Na+/H+ antiporter NhaA [Oceanicola sp. D3]|uniref:Na+/H+ antiporter NhaA n=1 Tax=Oceanicola sp. D3 TaxID=2587163 RepID=UPI0011229B70|nr:Na+/H+ antiporter NhaA [Oceanicola sp. D3]QDC08233.1 Na+/H+ antiporter NhaA [Oceanicola sp. D3]
MLRRKIDEFFGSDAAGGIVLMLSAVAAMMIANSSLNPEYQEFLGAYIGVTVNGEGIEKPALLWINDGLMAIFFFLIGLELKRELMEGKLKNPADVVLPGMAAVGGMVVPALVYLVFNWGNAATIHGWAIPAATDIAFALGVLALLGSRVPASLKIFLLTLAILDDMGAILIIALFYTAELKIDYLFLACIPLALMIWRNMRGAHRVAPILLLGVALWVLVLKSGVHATLAGVVTAFCIPLKDKWNKSPLHSLEHGLSPYVLYVIVPIFAFANAGVVLKGMSFGALLDPVPLGVALGLILGKQVGVFGTTWLMVKMGLAKLPFGVTWAHIYGLACLAGIGFTMSLFIGSLSFDDALLMNEVRLGVLLGSGVSALIGYFVLRAVTRPGEAEVAEALNQPGAAERAEAAAE